MDVIESPRTRRGASGARERSRLATRARLLGAARALFAEHGLHGVTSHDIARAAGVAAGTFYLHFPDKQAMFREIVYEAVRQLRERLETTFETALASGQDLERAVRAHAGALVEFAAANADLVRIVFGRDHGDVEVETDVLDYLAQVGADVLRRRIAQGSIRTFLNPAVASQALTGMFVRVIAWWIDGGMSTPRDAMIDTLVGIQLQGIYQE
jgi:AcrR family transcriptional regulator